MTYKSSTNYCKLRNFQSVFCFLFLGILPIHAQLTRTSSNSNNQNISPPVKCLTDQLLQQKIAINPSYANSLQLMNQKIFDAQNSASRAIQTIPVVVHVIHQNGVENITDQQIFDGIQHLNDAFANSGAYFDQNGTDANIRFCLAQQDPYGYLTNGITRTESELTNVTAETQDAALKSLIRWNQNKYLNIWLVKEITSLSMGAGIAGYAYFPTSQGQAEDGIVNEASFFGSSVNNSKVHIHEAGHYLGLYHTFEGACTNNNCQTDGDHVCDTPPDQSTGAVNCNDTPNTCTTDADDPSNNNPFRAIALGGLGDQPDQFPNYMDYGFQACQKFFTAGQATRMQAALNEERAILLQSIACVSPCFNPISIIITTNSQQIVAGDSATFNSNTGLPNIVEWKINNQIVGNQYQLTYLFPAAGIYTVELTAFNNSPNCLVTKTLLIVHVECPSQANFNFTSTSEFNPGNQITAVNLSSNNLSNQWILDGQPSSNNTIWTQTFLTAGSHALYLITGNGTCLDTSATKFFQVGNCNYSKVTDNWIFLNGGMKFTEGGILWNPSLITNFNNECSSSISDADGNLLFFSDGNIIWDANYNIMPNGDSLLGCQSSSQAVLITPNPGNPNQFYVFTNDCVENALANGLRYSLVDMTLNGGLGDVVPNYKNIKILNLGSEKLSATWHANGRDIWLGAQETSTNKWYAFLIDNNGINIQPVISNIGSPSQIPLGGMRFSNDGNRMAACMLSEWPWRILVADFNKQTGEYSNPIELLLSTEFNQQPFSTVFSPDNSKLYVGFWQGSDLFQYDLTYTTVNAIQNSRYTVDAYEVATFGQLVLASNGKIYVNPNTFGGGIDEIREPNLAGAACQYYSRPFNDFPAFYPLTSGSSLPNMLQGYLNPSNPVIAGPQNICKGGVTSTYGIALASAEDSTIWQHTGQGVFSAQNGQNSCTLTSGNNIGTDTIFATVYGRCGITRDTIHIQTNERETTNLPEQITGCGNLFLNPGNDFTYYLWQDGSTQNPYFVDTAGVYFVTLKGHSGCIFTDTTIYSPYPLVTNLSLGLDLSICGNQVVVLQTTQNYQSYTWQDGSQNSTYTAFNPGSYWVTVPSGCESSVSDTIQISASSPINLNLNLNGANTVCKTALPFTLNAPAGFTTYLWSTGANTQNLPLTSIGTYTLLATDADGCEARDTFYVIDCILGLNETETKNSFSIFPNPANEEMQISFSQPESGTIQIFNNLGQICYSQEIKSTKQEKLNISNWSQGTYLVRFTSLNTFTSRVFVKH